DLIGLAGDDRVDRLTRLVERVLLGRPAQLGDRGEGRRDLARGIAARDVDGDAARLRVAQARRLAPVVVLERDDDVRVLGLAHDGDRHAEAARRVLDAVPGDTEGIDLDHLAVAIGGDPRRAAA